MDPFDVDWRSLLEERIVDSPVEPDMPLKAFLLANNYELWEERHSSAEVKLTCTSPLGGEVRIDYERQVLGKETYLHLTKIVIRPAITPGTKVTPIELSVGTNYNLQEIKNYITPMLH